MFASVIVDIVHSEVDRIFEYSFDCNELSVGSRVRVPFGKNVVEGIVVSISDKSNYPIYKIKPIISVLDKVPALTEETLKLADFIISECHVTKASALRLFLPVELRKNKAKEQFIPFQSRL